MTCWEWMQQAKSNPHSTAMWFLYLSGAHCSVIPYEHCGLSNLALSQVRIQDRIIENGLTQEGSEEDSHGLWL